MLKLLKKLIPIYIKQKIIYLLGSLNYFKYFKYKSTNKVFVFLSCDYKNIGDAAITYSQVSILKKTYPIYNIIEVPLRHSISHLLAIKLIAKNEDIITIIGGGHFGDLYPGYQQFKNRIIANFPNNYIISFPQSYNFKLKDKSQLLDSVKRIYDSHNNLLLMMRDEYSYKMAKKELPATKVILAPDVVLTQDFFQNPIKRSGISIILRNDKESILTSDDKLLLENLIKSINESYIVTDTLHKEKMLDANERNKVFIDFINNIKSKSLVITDRLHAVIFCYVTKTPCIAINSYGNKVKNAVDTYMKCDYIFLETTFNIELIGEKLNLIFKEKSNFNFINKTKTYSKNMINYLKQHHVN